MSKFGAMPVVCCLLWNRIDPYVTMPDGVHKKHLLWALYFLKVYDTEENSAQSIGGVDKQTFRVWSFRFVEAMSYLESSVVRLLKPSPALFTVDNTTALYLFSLNSCKDTLEQSFSRRCRQQGSCHSRWWNWHASADEFCRKVSFAQI